MSDESIDEYLLVPHEQIDFASLSSSLLPLAVQQSEPFVATSALGRLAVARVPEARAAALQILASPWDRYLTSCALTILFDGDRDAAMLEMERLLPDCRDAVVLAGMVENVLSDLETFARGRHAELARALARRVSELGSEEFRHPEEVDQLLALFEEARR